MRLDNCPYCNVVYPHKSQAQQHAEMANHMMGNMMQQQAQIQNQWRAGFGLGPQAPMAPPPMGAPGVGGANLNAYAQQAMAQANRNARNVMLAVVIGLIVVSLVVAGVVVFFVVI